MSSRAWTVFGRIPGFKTLCAASAFRHNPLELSDRERESATLNGGGGGIRTPGTLSGPTVFKTAGFNRSPTPPVVLSLTGKAPAFQTLGYVTYGLWSRHG